MPLYLDVHHRVDGLTGRAVQDAHRKDLEVQGKYGAAPAADAPRP